MAWETPSDTVENWTLGDPDQWLMATAFWRDEGMWVDFPALWHDYPNDLWMDPDDTEEGWTARPDVSGNPWHTVADSDEDWQDV